MDPPATAGIGSRWYRKRALASFEARIDTGTDGESFREPMREEPMAGTRENALAITEILETFERLTKEVNKSLDPMRNKVDYDRLLRVKQGLGHLLEQLDSVLANRTE